MADTYNESNFIFKLEERISEQMRYTLEKLGGYWMHNPIFLSRSNDLPHRIALGGKGSDKRRRTILSFNKFGYKGGSIEEGEPTIYEKVLENAGWERTISADKDGEAVNQKISESEKLVNEESEAWNVNASFEVTNRTSIKAEASAGNIASASAESETTTRASTEFGKGGTAYKKTEHSFAIGTELMVKPGQTVQATVEVSEKKVVTPIVQTGLIDFEITLDLYDWALDNSWHLRDGIWKGKGSNVITFSSRQELINFFRGRDERQFPNMKHFVWDMSQAIEKNSNDWRAKYAYNFVHWLEDDNNFSVRLSKERVQVFKNAGTLRQRVLQDNSPSD